YYLVRVVPRRLGKGGVRQDPKRFPSGERGVRQVRFGCNPAQAHRRWYQPTTTATMLAIDTVKRQPPCPFGAGRAQGVLLILRCSDPETLRCRARLVRHACRHPRRWERRSVRWRYRDL